MFHYYIVCNQLFLYSHVYFVSKMSNVSQHSSNKLGKIIEKLVSEMAVSNVDQLPVQIASLKVEVELTSYYQNQKGYICNLTKYIGI